MEKEHEYLERMVMKWNLADVQEFFNAYSVIINYNQAIFATRLVIAIRFGINTAFSRHTSRLLCGSELHGLLSSPHNVCIQTSGSALRTETISEQRSHGRVSLTPHRVDFVVLQ